MKALLRVDDKKELSDPPRVQEKELKEPERISLRTPKELEFKETELVSFFFQAEDGIRDYYASRGLGDVYKRQQLIVVHKHVLLLLVVDYLGT